MTRRNANIGKGRRIGRLARYALTLGFLAAPFQWSFAQVTLNMTNTTLKAVVGKIHSQTKTKFFYNDELVKTRIKHVKVNNVSLENALNVTLRGTDVTYSIDDGMVYLRRKQAPSSNGQKEQAPAKGPGKKEKSKITGRVLDENGEPMIGVVVAVKGSDEKAVTDIDGNYAIVTDVDKPVLSMSYIGYRQQELATRGQNVVNATMLEDQQSLNEVVVTALGIKREKKLLGYAVQDLKSDQLNTTGDASVTNALEGKVAGLQMNTSSTGLGGSTKITIRGNSSLTDDNQPLWIVDGVPFTDNQSSGATAYGGYDRGGTSFDINPEDIESISVLKGANAAALYGSRAGNGVILVTTKKGSRRQGFGVDYNGTFTWSQAAETIKMQKKYGQGNQGKVIYVTDDEGNRTITGELSFGPELDGHMEPSYLGDNIAYKYYGDKLKDYFNTGFSQFHTVSLGSSTDKSHFRYSLGYNDNKGLFQNETLNKLTMDLNAGTTVNKYLSLDGKVSISRTKAKNRPFTGLSGEVAQLLLIPGNVRLSDLENYSSDSRLHVNWFGPDQHYSNPYYVRHQRQNSDERFRGFGYFSANLDLASWLKVQARYAFDYYRTAIRATDLSLGDQAIDTDGTGWASKLTLDNMSRQEENHFEQNVSLNFMGDTDFTDKLRFGYTLGGNLMRQKYNLFGATVQNMLEKDNWIFNTGANLTGGSETGHRRVMYSAYGSAQLAWDEWISLDLTARNDWSSTLPAGNRSFFYPSASVSYVFSDFMRKMHKPLPSWVTFAKLRLSAAQVGKDPEPYNLYNELQFEFVNGVRTPVQQTIKKNSNLKPEIQTSYEVGLDMKFLENRLGFDFTWYHTSTKNQAMLVDASAPWSQQWINAGKVNNTGFELMLYGTPVKTRDWQVDLTLNMAHNKSTAAELAQGVDRIYFNGDGNMPVKVGAVKGGKLGDIYANNLMKRDGQGRIVVDSRGLPQPETGNGNLEQYILSHPIGNIQPDLLMSFTPTISYKGIGLTAMFDMKFGGDIVSVSEGMATLVGTSARTEYRGEFKELNGVSDYYMVVPGVKADGSANDIPVSAQSYYSTIGLYGSQQGYAEEFVHDASYIKLKELSLGYSFPQSILKRTPFTRLKLSFVARNLCFLMKHTPGNPSGGYDTTMFSQALDFAAVPYTRSFGFSVGIGF